LPKGIEQGKIADKAAK